MAVTSEPVKPARLKRFRGLYLIFSLFAVLIVATGFYQGYWGPLLAGTLDKEWVVDLHAAVFVGWVALFIAQATLAYRRRIALHRKLGQFGIYYGLVVIAMGYFVMLNQLANGVHAGHAAEAQAFLLIPLVDMIIFPAFFAAAVWYRDRPEWHKRLMLVATTELLTAPVARLDLDAYMQAHWSVFAIWLAPIYLAMAYDYATKRLIHPIYVIGLVVLALSMLRVGATQNEAWLSIARVISGWVT